MSKRKIIPRFVDNSAKLLKMAKKREKEQKKIDARGVQLVLAQKIYEEWKGEFLSTGCRVHELTGRFDELRSRLRQKVKDKVVLRSFIERVHKFQMGFMSKVKEMPPESEQKPEGDPGLN